VVRSDAAAETDADGRFRISAALEANDGSLDLRVSAPNCTDLFVEVPNALESPPLDVRLWRSAHVRGRVVDETGNPLPGAYVSLCSSGSSSVETDATGAFRLAAPAGDLTLAVMLRGTVSFRETFAGVAPGREQDAGTVVLAKSGAVEGSVRRASGEVGERLTIVLAEVGRTKRRWAGLTDSAGWYRVEVDASDGGAVEVLAAEESYGPLSNRCRLLHAISLGHVQPKPGETCRRDGRLPEPATLAVSLDAPAGPGLGCVHDPVCLDLASAPRQTPSVPGFTFTLTALDHMPLIWTDAEPFGDHAMCARWSGNGLAAEFEIATLPAGDFEIAFSGDGRETTRTRVTLRPGTKVPIALRLP
jgi:hypothetical protein